MNMLSSMALKPPLILLPGWGFDRSIFASWQAELERYYDVHCVDLPGYNDAALTLETWCADLAAELSQPAVVVGWSLGGQAAVQFAHRHPAKVSALINIAGNPSFVQRNDWRCAMPTATFNEFAHGFSNNPKRTLRRFASLVACDTDATRQLQKSLCDPAATLPTQQQGLAYLQHWDVRDELKQLTMPVLHLLGECDQLVPLELAKSLRALVPQQQVRTVSDAGHAVFLHGGAELATQIHQFAATGNAAGLAKTRVAQSFSRAAATYDAVAHLQRQVGNRLFASLPGSSAVILDLGCGTGSALSRLRRRFPAASLIAIDIAQGMLQFAKTQHSEVGSAMLCADAEHLPLASQSIDCIFSNLAVQWCDLGNVVRECHRVLKPGGMLRISTLGPDTLHELRTAWSEADAYVHVNRFTSVEEVRNALADSGFNDGAVERELIMLEYSNVRSLTSELKALGAHNINNGAAAGLTGEKRLRAMLAAYERQRNDAGMLPASYEALYVSATKIDG